MKNLLEVIEQVIECLNPGDVVQVSEVLQRANAPETPETKEATVMLLLKYGIGKGGG